MSTVRTQPVLSTTRYPTTYEYCLNVHLTWWEVWHTGHTHMATPKHTRNCTKWKVPISQEIILTIFVTIEWISVNRFSVYRLFSEDTISRTVSQVFATFLQWYFPVVKSLIEHYSELKHHCWIGSYQIFLSIWSKQTILSNPFGRWTRGSSCRTKYREHRVPCLFINRGMSTALDTDISRHWRIIGSDWKLFIDSLASGNTNSVSRSEPFIDRFKLIKKYQS